MLRSTRTRPIRWPVWLLATFATAASARPCAELAMLPLDHTDVTGAGVVAAGAFQAPGRRGGFGGNAYGTLPEFCRVEAVARPGEGSEIRVEVWLPTESWNGKLQGVGNGAWAGSIGYRAMAGALGQGYAVTSTDTGHVGGRPDFALEHPDKLVDFAHRAVHEMTVTAKAVTAAFYERPYERAYFAGCSTGGRQALTQAQRYPDDYDGIVAGAAAYYPSHIQGMQVWTAAVSNRSEAAKIGAEQFRLVNDAVIAACDTIDGVADGVIENPRACGFDPAVLACTDGSGDACLTPEQIETVSLVYRGPETRDGDSLFPGLERGSELGWATLSGTAPLALAEETFSLLVHGDSGWDWAGFDADAEIAMAVERIGPLLDASDPDIGAFVEGGGKLLLYHGWNDPGIPPRGTIRYHDSVVESIGSARAGDAVRLFMVPGMNHCGGGTGTTEFDAIAALDGWLETGSAPDRIEAERREGGEIVRSRPLCAYPSVAVYAGRGSTDEAPSFVCR